MEERLYAQSPSIIFLYFCNYASFVPQFEQNLAPFVGVPQFGQKLPVTVVPHAHFHPPAACGAGVGCGVGAAC